jgi:hypothetical protein
VLELERCHRSDRICREAVCRIAGRERTRHGHLLRASG